MANEESIQRNRMRAFFDTESVSAEQSSSPVNARYEKLELLGQGASGEVQGSSDALPAFFYFAARSAALWSLWFKNCG